MEELSALLSTKGRRIVVAKNPVDLMSLEGHNTVYVLFLPGDSHAAGGRAGGFGERRVERVACFSLGNGDCQKLFEVEDPNSLEKFELPYHATGLEVTLTDGSRAIVSGVVDSELVEAYGQAAVES